MTFLVASQFVIFTFTILYSFISWQCTEAKEVPINKELLKGFKVTPNPSISSFQPLLYDSSGNFSLGFLRIEKTQLALSILHLPSMEPLWTANTTRFPRWSDHTELTFNGSLVISDPKTRVFWSTSTQLGDRVVLLNNSNLQIQKKFRNSQSVFEWQSFDFPTNTLIENQIFTHTMTLVSSNGQYSMSLGNDFIGLYAKFKQGRTGQIYWKRRALEAKAKIVEGKGPIYARVNSDGYLGMYQTGNTVPVDIQAFNSFQRHVKGLFRVRLEPDGNLKGYFWDGSKWVLDYEAISAFCELPSPCGSYGLCTSGSGCSCLDNRTEIHSGECSKPQSGDFCSVGLARSNFRILKRKGIELPYKELTSYERTLSLEQCESFCEKNCSCWGAVYNNASGFCYMLDYPIQTLLRVGDESKMGYFKVKEDPHRRKGMVGIGIGIGFLCGTFLVLVGIIGFVSYRICMRRRRREGKKRLMEEEGVIPGSYKDLGSESLRRSIEMCS